MLVLRRKASESIILNGVIKITILCVEGDRVKIGIQAPEDVSIVREEILDPYASTSAVQSVATSQPCHCCMKTRCRCMIECDSKEMFCLRHEKLIAVAPFPIEAVS